MKQYTFFPQQKIATGQKNKQWFIDCIDAAEGLVVLRNTGELQLKHKMNIWYNLDKDIIDETEIESVFNPMQINSGTIPASIRNYSLTIPKIDLLQGEEIKRRFDWSVVSKNEDAHSNYTKALKDELIQVAMQTIESESFDEKQVQEKLKNISKYYTYEYKELFEVTVIRILQYLWREQDIKEKFSKGFRDALISSREIYRIDSFGQKPVVVKIDPRNVFSIRRGDSHRIEDSDIIVEISYEPIGKIIDEFHEDLKPSEIDQLEAGYQKLGGGNGNGVLNYENRPPVIYSNLETASTTMKPLDEYQNIQYAYGLPFDVQGNVRVIRARWLSRRKVGTLTYFDENGTEQQKLVSEYYKPNKELGEWVKWFWINEACEGTRLGGDIYVRCRIRPIQMRHFDNPSMCFLGYVGTDYGESMMGRMEPYQYLYNVYMRRLELVLARYKGPIVELDLSKKPDEWDTETWMYYADTLGYMIVDSFKEGKKGQAQGKLAGTFNTTGKVLDPNIGNYIQQLVTMLQYIESQVGKIAGVTPQREGAVDNRETVGGVERSVTQSSHITEKWFFIHDQTKRRVLQALLDTAKQLYSSSKEVNLNFILDDMSKIFLQFNGEDFASSEYDIFSSNSSDDQEIRELVKQLSHAAVQGGASMLLPIKVLRSDSISDMAKKLELDEQERLQREQESQDKQLQTQERMNQANIDDKEKDRELNYYKIDKEFEKALTVASMSKNTEPEDNSLDKEKLALDRKKQQEESNLKRDQLNETIRHNKKAEEISNKPKSSNK